MAEEMLRATAPAVGYRSVAGVGKLIYRNDMVPVNEMDESEQDRLVDGGFVERVRLEGGSWVRVEDGPAGSAGDFVTVGAQGDSGVFGDDPGLVNTAPGTVAASTARAQSPAGSDPVAEKRSAAQARLAEAGGKPSGKHGEDVWVEAAVAAGYSYEEASKAGKPELQRLLAEKK